MKMTESEKKLYLEGSSGLAPYLRMQDKGMPQGKVNQIAWLLLNGSGCGFCKVCRDEPCNIKDGEKCTTNIANYIREIVKAEEQPKTDWILCEERLPLPKGNEQMVEVDVTVAGNGGNVRVPAFYFFATCNFHVYGIGGSKIKNVIAWMPKPEPYNVNHLGEVNGMVQEGNSNENT